MYGHVIVGVDGRQGGRDAAALALMLCARDAFVSLVYVSTPASAAGHRDRRGELDRADEDALRGLLSRELYLCGGGAQLVRVIAASVAAGLEDVARRHDADLVIVGAAHRHGFARVVAGDDVSALMHQTPRAVAVAPAGYAGRIAVPARIGVAYDGSPESEVALAHAGLLAGDRHSLLAVRHAVEPRYYPPGIGVTAIPADDPDCEIAAARELCERADGIEVEHAYGPVSEVLVAFAGQLDLLVCGSRRTGSLRRLALGSTSAYLARHVATPLLITPPVDAENVERWRAGHQNAVA